jgi:PadR family transcriptional regulator PadR
MLPRMGGRQTYLGEFEQVVLLAVVRLGPDAYGAGVREEIAEHGGRAVTIGALYATLDRLETKGYLRSRDEIVGGRPRRSFSLTPEGAQALETARALQQRMWDGVRLSRSGRRS